MEDSDAKFEDINEEFNKVVKVAPVASSKGTTSKSAKPNAEKPVEKEIATPAVTAQKATTPITTKNTDVKTPTAGAVTTPKTSAAAKTTAKREPEHEDSEGFAGRRPIVDPYRPGEKVVLAVNYFNVTAGDLSIEVKPFKFVNDKKAYHFQMSVETNRTFSMFYAVKNIVDTLVDFETLVPQTLTVDARESSRLKEAKTFFDWQKSEATLWEKVIKKDGQEKKKRKTWAIDPYSQNIISAAYYLRAFKLTIGKTFHFRIADDGKNYTFKGEVLRKEDLKTDAGTFSTIVVRPTFTLADEFKPTGENLIWFTDDDRKFPVRIESKIKIGTLVARLKSIEKGGP